MTENLKIHEKIHINEKLSCLSFCDYLKKYFVEKNLDINSTGEKHEMQDVNPTY